MSGLRFAALLVVSLLLSACSVVQQRSTPAPVREIKPPPVQVPPTVPAAPEPGVQTAPYRPPGAVAPAQLPSEGTVGTPSEGKPPAGGYTAPAATLVAFAEQAQNRGD